MLGEGISAQTISSIAKSLDEDVYPKIKRQRCWAHKLRNVSKYHFYNCPSEIRVKVRTTNIYIERAFREVRRRKRPMSCFINVQGIERIAYAVMSNLNDQWGIKSLKEIDIAYF